jgi:hypothetical protein
MHARQFALATLIYAVLSGWASGAPLMSALPEAKLQAYPQTQPIRWRHRWSRDYEWTSRRGSEGGETGLLLGAENPSSLLERLNRDARRRQGWKDPPPPQQ